MSDARQRYEQRAGDLREFGGDRPDVRVPGVGLRGFRGGPRAALGVLRSYPTFGPSREYRGCEAAMDIRVAFDRLDPKSGAIRGDGALGTGSPRALRSRRRDERRRLSCVPIAVGSSMMT